MQFARFGLTRSRERRRGRIEKVATNPRAHCRRSRPTDYRLEFEGRRSKKRRKRLESSKFVFSRSWRKFTRETRRVILFIDSFLVTLDL